MKSGHIPAHGGLDTESRSADWKEMVRRYQVSSTGRAVWQLSNTLVPYAALWVLMYFALGISWWLVVPQEEAIVLVLAQAQALADEWSAG